MVSEISILTLVLHGLQSILLHDIVGTLLHDVYASIECVRDMPQIWVYEIIYKLCGPVLVNDLILHDANSPTGCAWNIHFWVYKHYKQYKSMLKIDLILQIGIIAFDAAKHFFDCIILVLCPPMVISENLCDCSQCHTYKGGYKVRTLTYNDIKDYIDRNDEQLHNNIDSKLFQFVDYASCSDATKKYAKDCHVFVNFPPSLAVQYMPVPIGRQMVLTHGYQVGSRTTLSALKTLLENHKQCDACKTYITVLVIKPSLKEHKCTQWKKKQLTMTAKERKNYADLNSARVRKFANKARFSRDDETFMHDLASVFPPEPVDKELSHKVITDACRKLEPDSFEETGCGVCGQLVPVSRLSKLSSVKNYLHILEAPGVTKQERFKRTDKMREFPTAIDHKCNKVCNDCRASLRLGKVPKYALAKGLWLGPVPEVLSSLRYFERMLIARVRHSCCSIKVSSGMRKMKAHAIAYQQPIPKVYNILPPPKADVEEVIAIMFTGPCKPTSTDFQRTPFLVRRNHVKKALEWLILNHIDYADVTLSTENLNEYPEDMPPVSVEYKQMLHNKTPEGTSVHDMEEEDGTAEGDCAFTVHGLTGQEFNVMTTNAVKMKALHHLNTQGKFLAIGHKEEAESIWNNPQLYPQMFPWLFPYGLGGIGTVAGMSDAEHKRRLLMYHDKRFQVDPDFPFIAFSHEQVKTASSQSFLLADKKIFEDIKNRILTVDNHVLKKLLERMNKDEHVKAENEAEEQCFRLIKDLDHIAGPVKGSNTSKKWMRNEIWSLIYHRGAPFWYITISPADIKHPLCIYYADKKEEFSVEILPYDERLRLICSNPVAGARFFDFMVKLFITDILGVDVDHIGLYGDTTAYYGTVEQQGRLTLHIHMLIWLIGNLTPQEMRKRILDPNIDFQKKLISWLESCHIGEFMTGSKQDILERVAKQSESKSYRDPTETLPQPPPPLCQLNHSKDDNCQSCTELNMWWKTFDNTVDDLLSKSNIHNCERGINKDGSVSKRYVSCKDNKEGKCKARFPRSTFESTQVDPETGALSIKKHEAWMNFITPVLTYITRCNTDVTCMWSGTALKAVIMYVSDYITKTGLKTHIIFESIRSVFDKHNEILSSSLSEREKARKLMNKIVNALSTKNEMGAPMVCMYLLDNPDHYTNHKFVPFYWYAFVAEAQKAWEQPKSIESPDKVTLIRTKKRVVGLSPSHDYIYRPSELEFMTLYEWARLSRRQKFTNQTKNSNNKSGTTKAVKYKGYHRKQTQKAEDVEDSASSSSHDDDDDDDDDNDDDDDDDDNSTDNESASDEEDSPDIPKDDHIPEKLPKNMYKFDKRHPLYETHGSVMIPKDANRVVNFIGKNLPRRDQGDREFYCLTMLALFKPWRCGLDLKPKHKSWDETFNEHTFTPRQEQLMSNFHIKYECLDARDDFHAQMKAGSAQNGWPLGQWGDNDNDGENEISLDQDPYVNPENISDVLDLQKVSFSEMNRQKEAREIKEVLRKAGWLDEVFDINQDIHINPINPQNDISSSAWKSVLQAKKQEILDLRSHPSETLAKPVEEHFIPNVVKVIDKAYLEKKYHTTENNISINSIQAEFNLNEEQERAFKIIANHVVLPNSEPLKMYIGGMGGTGKSQVLKAVCKFFESRNESYRFITVAPTGTAAALLSGSTYHSVLGINEMTSEAQSAKALTQVRTRLLGVDYIFLDEVSMLSCYDMYRISSQLCKVMNKPTEPFGGLNVLFAGDFAQLPPPVGGENISLYSRTIGKVATNEKAQQEALGRALWHQVTTVVILRKNMRQQSQSKEDDQFRTALDNMRYKDCTPADIQFLRSLITSKMPGKHSIASSEFRFVSIITAKNAQKDEINQLGSERFAQETGQQLVHFYSEDMPKPHEDTKRAPKKSKATLPLAKINDKTQHVLWNLPHSSADKHVAGKLSLCHGMPIMIKCNVATELCITNGQEATVVGWKATIGKRQQQMLDVLFVQLKSPPKPVNIDGLPENVVPLTRSNIAITCKLPDGSKVSISRSQVEVLPNFAMTDFASQGKTRPYNPVDLNNCRSHQAYYTALSRSSTAAGTVILQGFDAKKITGRASGALRQEFRDLELLDEITKSRYDGKLANSICGECRNALIHTFRLL